MLDSLNKEQKRAVVHQNGPLLILAGAGSGKTRALTYRLAYLVLEKGISPLNILCLTFTNKAAQEMKQRVHKLLNSQNSVQIPWMGTFHSICAKILRQEIHNLAQGFTQNFSIYDEDDSLSLIKKIIKEKNIEAKKYPPQMIRAIISQAKNELISTQKYKNYARSPFEKMVAEIYVLYEKALKDSNALDFDNLINKTVELFKIKSILKKYQQIFKYILVDEYQDTNHAQFILLKKLASKDKNISVVGDDWQSIYRFRGADFRNILEFKKDYPEAKIIKLEENYRSTGNIIDAAQSVIENNSLRSEKKLYTKNIRGEKVKIIECHNHEEEGEFIVKEVTRLNQSTSEKYNHSVVLYRTNAQSRVLEEILLRYNIPYRIIGGVRFYERTEIKDVLAYLKILVNESDLNSLLRIINVPSRGISKAVLHRLDNEILTKIIKGEIEEKDIANLNQRAIKAIINFTSKLKALKNDAQKFNIADLIPKLIKKTGYKDHILDGSEEGESRFENIRELISVANSYSHLAPQESLLAFLEETSLIADIDNYDNQATALTLMTIHNAKGLEFDNVFIAGMEEGVFPHSRSMFEPEELEEERRLCYVGMTRAKKQLYLLRAQSRLLWGGIQYNSPSRFLEEINPNYIQLQTATEYQHGQQENSFEEESQIRELELEVGDKIVHLHFGQGVVESINDDEITVDFAKLGKKHLSKQYAPIKKT